MNKRILKIIVVILISIFVIAVISEYSFVKAIEDGKIESMFGSEAEKNTDGANVMVKILGATLTIVRIAGVGIGVIMLTVLGSKYMISSAGEKAEIKKHAITYVTGAIIMISAAAILGIVQKSVESALKSE